MKKYLLAVLCVILPVLCLPLANAEDQKQILAPQGNITFFEKNGLYGLQTVEGEELHAATFDGVGFFDDTDQANVRVGEKIGRINRFGEVVIEPFACDAIEAIPTDFAPATKPAFLLLVKWHDDTNETTMGLMDTSGKWISDIRFDVKMSDFCQGWMYIAQNDKYNRINVHGELQSEIWWDYCSLDLDGSATVETGGDILEITPTGEIWFKAVLTDSAEKVKYKYYLISNDELFLCPSTWTNIKFLCENRIGFEQNHLWGIADFQGNIVLPPEWNNVGEVNGKKGIWFVRSNAKAFGFMNELGEMILPIDEYDFSYLAKGLYFFANMDSSGVGMFMDGEGNIVATLESKYYVQGNLENNEQYFRFVNLEDETWGFVDRSAHITCELSDFYLDYRDGYTEIVNGWFRIKDADRDKDDGKGQCGYVNVQGTILLSSEWSELFDFSANGLARVSVNGEFGYINTNGDYSIEPQWASSGDFFQSGNQWIAQVEIDSEYGYINEHNELIAYGM